MEAVPRYLAFVERALGSEPSSAAAPEGQRLARILSIIGARFNGEQGPRASAAVPRDLRLLAAGLGVSPDPVFDESMAADGEVAWDGVRGQFIVRLRRSVPSWTTDGRSRFTFAHELGHRLLFVRTSDGLWSRVHRLACSEVSEAARSAAALELWRMEERLCNRIAATFLLPDAWSDRRIELLAGRLKSDGLEVLPEELRTTSAQACVSLECASVWLGQVSKRLTQVSGNEFSFTIVSVPRKDSGFSEERSRVLAGWMPVDSLRRRAVFPGADVARGLGLGFASLAQNAARSSRRRRIAVTVPLIANQKAPARGTGYLRGWCEALHDVAGSAPRLIMIWGRLYGQLGRRLAHATPSESVSEQPRTGQ